MGGMRLGKTSAVLTIAVAGLWAPQAYAADAITVALGGRIKQFFFVTDQDQAGPENLNPTGMFNDTRIAAEGRTVLDNGISVRAYARFTAAARVQSNLDEAYVDINSTFGRLRMGEKSGANTSIIGDPIPQAFLTVDEEIFGDALVARTGITVRDAFTFKRFTGNALGVSYQSPELLGIKLGVAYHPTATSNVGPIDNRLLPHNAFDVTAGYEGDFAGGTYRLSGGYFSISSRTGGNDGAEAWNVSAGLTYGGWELAGAYINVTPTNGLKEDAWTVGALYGIGPWRLSADYRSAKRRVLPGVREHADRTTVQTAYKLGPGISVGLAGFYGDQKDVAGVDWDGGGVLGGVKIDF
jgi:predicted porin